MLGNKGPVGVDSAACQKEKDREVTEDENRKFPAFTPNDFLAKLIKLCGDNS